MPKKKIILKGIPANRGIVRGKVRIIDGDKMQLGKELKKVKKGEILVTQMTRPTFVPIMKKVKGVITDRGGILCHAAMVAREFNLPCIVNTKEATKKLKNGQEIILDANKGIVYEP